MREWDQRDERADYEHGGKTADKHRHRPTTDSPSLEVDTSR